MGVVLTGLGVASNFARALHARLIATNSSTESLPTLEHLPTPLNKSVKMDEVM